MLKNGLACAERTRYAEGTALCDWQESINTTKLHDQRLIRTKSLCVALDRLLDRLRDHHAELLLLAEAVLDDADGGTYIIRSLFLDGLYGPVIPLQGERNHDMVGEDALRNGSDGITGHDAVPCLYARCEFPVLIRDRVEVYTSLQEETTLLCKLRQRVLKSIIDLCQKSRTQINTHQLTGKLDRITDLDAI